VKEYKRQGGKYKGKSSRKKSKSSRKKSKSSRKKSRKKSKSSRKKSRKKSKSSRKKSRKKSKSKSTGLKRWFKERWIDVCKLPKIVECGRKKTGKNWKKNYPYCRPYKRVNSGSPKTAKEIMKSKGIKELRKRCKQKRRSPLKRMRNS
jgi:histone H1/5